jgi:hypothetical protein
MTDHTHHNDPADIHLELDFFESFGERPSREYLADINLLINGILDGIATLATP